MNSVNSRPYHHGNLREEMLRIAVELTAEHGPDGLGLRMVARQAGVSPSAAYRHFTGIDQLLEEVRGRVLAALGRRVHEALDEAADRSPEEQLRAVGRGYVGFAVQDPLLFRSMSSGFFPVDGRWEGTPLGDLLHLVEEVLPASQRATATERAVALWSMVHGFSILCTQGALKDVEPDRRRVLLESALDLAVRGLVA